MFPDLPKTIDNLVKSVMFIGVLSFFSCSTTSPNVSYLQRQPVQITKARNKYFCTGASVLPLDYQVNRTVLDKAKAEARSELVDCLVKNEFGFALSYSTARNAQFSYIGIPNKKEIWVIANPKMYQPKKSN